MNDRTITFAASAGLSAPSRRWLEPVLSTWPGDQPNPTSMLVDVFLATLESDASSDPAPLPGTAFVVLGPDEPTSRIDRIVEAMHRRHLPGVVLTRNPDDWQVFQRHGVIFDSLEADLPRISAMLFALGERQGAVRLLAHEIQLAQRCQGGIRSEMDRIHEELHLAASIQRDFTSSPVPRVRGLDIEVLFRPVNFVSGDVYNVRDLGDGRAAFFVADAVGHGVPAALLTMVLTSSLTTSEYDAAGRQGLLEPAEVLARLNKRMCASCFGSGRFATAVYGVVDSNARTVTVAGAGHPMPVVLSPHQPREIETNGPLLGVFGEAEFDQCTVSLADDETLLVYTDGLDAALPAQPGSAMGPRRLEWLRDIARMRAQAVHAGASLILAELQGMLDAQSGSLHQNDDVTAVCIAPTRMAA